MGTRILLLGILLLTSFAPSAKTLYVDDTLYAPLRSGQGLGFRIVHKGLKSGTALEALEEDSEAGYTKVRTPQGLEGWLPTRFLSRESISKDKLAKLSAEHVALKAKYQELKKKSDAFSAENNSLRNQSNEVTQSNQSLQVELANIKRISANAIQLDVRNRELRETSESLKNEVELLSAENTQLKANNDRDKMITGAVLLVLGMLIAVILPLLKPKKKSAW